MRLALAAALSMSILAPPALAQDAMKLTCPRDKVCAVWCYAGLPKPENTVLRRGPVTEVTWSAGTQSLEYTTSNSQGNLSGVTLLRNNETCVFDYMTRTP
jgi:hypothetical protein